MTSKMVEVKRCAVQVVDGTHYKGYISIGDAVLNYEMQFKKPIARLDDADVSFANIEELRDTIPLTLTREDGQVIELTTEEYGYFIALLVGFVIEFYHNEQTRRSNDGHLGGLLSGKDTFGGLFPGVKATATISVESSGSVELVPELESLLNAPKFGCMLGA